MVEHDPGSSRTHDPPGIPATRENTPPAQSDEPLHQSEDDVEQQLVSTLAQEGGVEFVNHLLTKAVPLDSPPLPTSNIREWSFMDIMCMPKAQQEEWKTACREELESLRR
jgi:hypothetical protein